MQKTTSHSYSDQTHNQFISTDSPYDQQELVYGVPAYFRAPCNVWADRKQSIPRIPVGHPHAPAAFLLHTWQKFPLELTNSAIARHACRWHDFFVQTAYE